MRIKLYIYNPYPLVGGSETTLVRFLNSIDKNKYDINNDGKDEIISNPSEKFSVYEYNASSKNFKSKLNNINDSIRKWYGNTIKWFNYSEIINNKLKLIRKTKKKK